MTKRPRSFTYLEVVVQLHVVHKYLSHLFGTQSGPLYIDSLAISARDNIVLHHGYGVFRYILPETFAVSPKVFILLNFSSLM